jgi:hypothetical protein
MSPQCNNGTTPPVSFRTAAVSCRDTAMPEPWYKRACRKALRPAPNERDGPEGDGRVDQRQVSFSVTDDPEAPVVYERLGSLSQVTLPSGFFLMYLYWTVVFAGSGTVPLHTG